MCPRVASVRRAGARLSAVPASAGPRDRSCRCRAKPGSRACGFVGNPREVRCALSHASRESAQSQPPIDAARSALFGVFAPISPRHRHCLLSDVTGRPHTEVRRRSSRQGPGDGDAKASEYGPVCGAKCPGRLCHFASPPCIAQEPDRPLRRLPQAMNVVPCSPSRPSSWCTHPYGKRSRSERYGFYSESGRACRPGSIAPIRTTKVPDHHAKLPVLRGAYQRTQ